MEYFVRGKEVNKSLRLQCHLSRISYDDDKTLFGSLITNRRQRCSVGQNPLPSEKSRFCEAEM